MADGLGISTGTDATVATDDCGASGHAQLFKLAYSANGVATLVQVDADGILVNLGANNDVSVTAVTPGTGATALGKAEDAAHTTGDVGVMALAVRNDGGASFGADGDYCPLTSDSAGNQNVAARRDLQRISVASGSLTTSVTAYTGGDQVGSQFTLAGAARASGGGGMIVGVVLISAADIIGAYDVVFTDSSITLASDNAAYAISDSDALKIVGIAQLAGAFDIGNNRVAQAYNLAIPYVCSGGTSLYAGLITRVGHTFFAAATDLQLIVYVERN